MSPAGDMNAFPAEVEKRADEDAVDQAIESAEEPNAPDHHHSAARTARDSRVGG